LVHGFLGAPTIVDGAFLGEYALLLTHGRWSLHEGMNQREISGERNGRGTRELVEHERWM